MAEFSFEFLKKSGLCMQPDFSFIEEFSKLREGESIPLVCEGYGTKGIGKYDNELIVLMRDDTELLYSNLLKT